MRHLAQNGGSGIGGTGGYLPTRVVTNDEIEQSSVDFDRARAGMSLDRWIRARAGVSRRRRAEAADTTALMGARAIERALSDAGRDARDLDLIVLSTLTADESLPQAVSVVRATLGSAAKCLQLDSGCLGFTDAIGVALSLMQTCEIATVAVCHSDAITRICNPGEFMMRSVFGDGAGAVVLVKGLDGGLLEWSAGGDARTDRVGWLRAGRTGVGLAPPPGGWLWMEHRAIFEFAVEQLTAVVVEQLRAVGGCVTDIDWLVAHQTGVNILDAVADRLGIDPDRCVVTIPDTGNISGATVPVALDALRRSGRLEAGQLVVMPAVGPGMAWGGSTWRWSTLPAPAGPADVPITTLAEIREQGLVP